jgi:endo-1,4-beta-D-glucanase Y
MKTKVLIISIFLFFCDLYSTNFPFPQFRTYPYGIKVSSFSQDEQLSILLKTYSEWKKNYLTKQGAPVGTYRIQRGSANSYDTVSEGIGYGMLILVLMDGVYDNTRQYFDGVYKYYQYYLDNNGLMNWQVDRNGSVIGSNAATDADEDVALALIFADKQWGSTNSAINYIEEAKEIINRIMKYQVERPSYILRPGDSFGGSELTNPSYFAPGWYRIFKKVTNDNQWDNVIDKCYEVLSIFKNKTETGLPPDWCDINGNQVSGYGYNYYYDACRVPWRIGMDYIWYGDNRAKEINLKISNWLKSSTGSDPTKIVAGYKITGEPLVGYSNAAFVGPFGVGSMVDESLQDWCNALFERLSRFGDGGAWGYYQDCLKMLTMLVMTGNFVNFYDERKSSFCLPTCQIVSPVDGEIVNGIVPVKLYAEDNNQLSKIELYFLNNKIYETYLSSKNVSIEYNWDTTSFLGQKGVFKSVCYNINGSSYTYFIEVEISSFSQTISDGSGKVKVLSQDFFVDTTQDVVLTFIATKDIYLGKIEVVLPEIFRNNFSSIEIKKRYGWPSISFCNFDTQSLKLEIGINKIFYSESFDIVIKNFVVQNSLGEHKILIKTKSNGGLLQEISSQPSIRIYTTNSKNKNKKVISLNKDYKNDKIVFDSPIVEIYNAKGKKVAEVKNGVWDGSDDQQNILKSGIYFYKTQDGEQGSIIILK